MRDVGAQDARQHPHDLATGLQGGIGDHPHEPHAGPTIHQPESTLGNHDPQLSGRCDVLGPRAGTGAREDTDAVHADGRYRPGSGGTSLTLSGPSPVRVSFHHGI